MRTRIALVAITSIALITVTLLTQAATVQPARASVQTPNRAQTTTTITGTRPTDRLTALVKPAAKKPRAIKVRSSLQLAAILLTGTLAGQKEAIPVIPPPPPPAPGPVDTVTPGQRAAWDRVAVCEEGGNWQADGSRFSGGLGITRANWANYGGLQYAPEAAEATPDEQIMVAERIQSYPPDQHGCSSW